MQPTTELLYQKKNYLKTNNLTSLLEKKKKDFIPYIFPVARIHTNSYKNISEKNRFEKLTDLFLKLRVYLFENPQNELIITKEFFIKHGIYNNEFFTFEKLSNFINFVKSEDCLKFHPSKSLKEIIFEVVNLPYEEYNEYLLMTNNAAKDLEGLMGVEDFNENENENNYANDNNDINEFVGNDNDIYNHNTDNNIFESMEDKLENENNVENNNENNNDNDNDNDDYNHDNIFTTKNSKEPKKNVCDLQVSAHLLTDNFNCNNNNNNHDHIKELEFNEKDLINYKTNINYSHLNKYQHFENTNTPNYINRTKTKFFTKINTKNNYNSTNQQNLNINFNNIKRNPTKNNTINNFNQISTKYQEKFLNLNNNNNKFEKNEFKFKSKTPNTITTKNDQNALEDFLLGQAKYRYHRGGNPILNEKIYKVEYDNPKIIIENLEPEIEKIKKSREEFIARNSNFNFKLMERNYEKSLDRIKKPQKLLEKFISTSGQLPIKDIEHIKKKNKLLEYIILQRCKNRFKLEDDKKVFDLYYGNSKDGDNSKDI